MALLPGGGSLAVTATSALESPTFAAVVRTLAEAVGTLPVHLYERGAGNSRQRDSTHPAAGVLSRPNPWTSRVELLTRMMLDTLTIGEAFALVVRVRGQPRELHRLDNSAVQVRIDDNTGEPTYLVAAKEGGQRTYAWSDVLHVQTPGSLPNRPLNLLDQARKAVALDLAMARYETAVFSKGARPSGLLSVPANTKPERRKAIHEVFTEMHSGRNAGGTAIVDDNVDWKPLSLTMVEADFLALRKHAAAEIGRIYRVPETLVGVTDRAVWRNIEELSDAFLSFGLLPWLEVWAEALERCLLATEERASRFIEFNLDGFAKANLSARYTAYRAATGTSWLTPNEVRALDNRPPVDGGDALVLQAGQTPTTPNLEAPLDGNSPSNN
jgi:HK97 family phage portal protein